MNSAQRKLLSTTTIRFAPREANSKAMLPVPENKSITSNSSKSKLLFKILNKLSFARSVVGLTGKFEGVTIGRPLWVPLIIRTDYYIYVDYLFIIKFW